MFGGQVSYGAGRTASSVGQRAGRRLTGHRPGRHGEAPGPVPAWRGGLAAYLIAWGLMGEPVPRVITRGGAQKKNS
jgi:hypothetical protein